MYEELKQAWSTLTAPGGQFEIIESEVGGQKLRQYKNAPPNLRALWQIAAAHADKEYLVYGDERWTYDRAHREVASIANWLLDHGVAPGDRVAIAMRNYPEWMLSYWACTSVGIAAIGVNAWWTGPELVYGIEDSDPKVIIADVERLERIDAHADEIGDRTLVGVRLPSERPGVVPFASLCDGKETLPEVEIDPVRYDDGPSTAQLVGEICSPFGNCRCCVRGTNSSTPPCLIDSSRGGLNYGRTGLYGSAAMFGKDHRYSSPS